VPGVVDAARASERVLAALAGDVPAGHALPESAQDRIDSVAAVRVLVQRQPSKRVGRPVIRSAGSGCAVAGPRRARRWSRDGGAGLSCRRHPRTVPRPVHRRQAFRDSAPGGDAGRGGGLPRLGSATLRRTPLPPATAHGHLRAPLRKKLLE
jgi:hypothetical protein